MPPSERDGSVGIGRKMETDNGQQGHSLSLVNVDLFEINLVAAKGVLLQGSGDAAPRWPFTPKARAKL